jgi:hypothetical protein
VSGATVLALGEADVFEKTLFTKQAVSTVRYADPAAWIVATAVARALAAAPEAVKAAGDRIGVVVTSPRGPVETMTWIATATREGYSSPLRYPATNPGSLAGVACIALTLRGPTLVLTMPPAQGAPLAITLGARWIARGDVALALVASCRDHGEPGKHTARCLLVGGASSAPALDDARDGRWLSGGDGGSTVE